MKAPLERTRARIARIKEIIRVWNTSETCQDAAKALGMKSSSLTPRVNYYKSRGIPMKMFSHSTHTNNGIDWDELAEYSREVRAGKVEPKQ